MRLCHISPEYLAENIEPHHLVRENPPAHEIVIDMMKLHITKKLNPRQEASRKSTLGKKLFRETTTIFANFELFRELSLIKASYCVLAAWTIKKGSITSNCLIHCRLEAGASAAKSSSTNASSSAAPSLTTNSSLLAAEMATKP
jgi:hypothetical protein